MEEEQNQISSEEDAKIKNPKKCVTGLHFSLVILNRGVPWNP